MRTTITLDDDVAMDLKQYAHDHHLSFKAVVNVMLRQGLRAAQGPARTSRIDPPVADLGGLLPDGALSGAEDPDGEIARFLRVTREVASGQGVPPA